MKILALDQSSRVTGYSIFENGELAKYGNFFYDDEDMGLRLSKIRSRVAKLVEENSIDQVILEDIQYQANVGNNVQTFKVLAEVYGVLFELCSEMNKPCDSVLSVTWKSGLKIKGRSRQQQKDAAADYVHNTFGIMPDQDTCDAICIGAYWLGDSLIESSEIKTDCAW